MGTLSKCAHLAPNRATNRSVGSLNNIVLTNHKTHRGPTHKSKPFYTSSSKRGVYQQYDRITDLGKLPKTS
jgi:hypothetical protein